MADVEAGGGAPAAGGAPPEEPPRPLGPDGKPIPGLKEINAIKAEKKMTKQQEQVEEVICIMHKNVENVLERDEKLGKLEERADALQDGCQQFEKQAAAMKNKFWLENLKSMIMMGVVGVIVLGLLYWKFMMPQPNPYAGYPPPPPPPPPPAPAAPADDSPAGDAGGGGGSEPDTSASDAGDEGGSPAE